MNSVWHDQRHSLNSATDENIELDISVDFITDHINVSIQKLQAGSSLQKHQTGISVVYSFIPESSSLF